MLEVGRAPKTIFLCRYLRDRDLQREINSGRNVAESWNRANAEIFYGKARDITSNRRDEQKMSVLCLHLMKAAMVYVSTLMLQDVLAEDEWSQLLTSEDYRGLTPLTWAHVAMHGEFKLNMNSRLDLGHTSPKADRLACVRAGSRSAVWAPQGDDGQKQVLEFSTLSDVENVALAPSQGHEWPQRAA